MCVLKEARGCTFACSAWREATLGFVEDTYDVLVLACRRGEVEMAEDLLLQGDTHGLALLFQLLETRIILAKVLDLGIERRDLRIFLEVEVVRILQVIDGWDEEMFWVGETIDDPAVCAYIMYARTFIYIMYAIG